MKLPKTLYIFRGLPSFYHGLTYNNTKLAQLKQEQLQEKIANAPSSGTLLVCGCAGPIVNQLMTTQKVTGLSFVEYFDSRLSDSETLALPQSPVVVIYDIGSEPAKNTDYSSKLLSGIIASYKSGETLLILETQLTATNFAQKYGITIKNSVTLPLQEEESWI
jgi:hypothetical protein